MKKALIIIGIAVVVLIGVFGVVFNTIKKSPEELALEYLNNIYSDENDTFTFINYQFDLFPGQNDRYIFKSEKYNSNITVKISESNNEYHFEDNYHTMYMYDDAKLYCENIALNLNNYEVKFRFAQTDYLNKYLTFEECKDNISFDVFYFTNYEVNEQQKQEILNKILGNCHRTVYFFVTTDNELLNNLDLDTILNNQSQYVKSESTYFIDYEGKIEKTN